MKLLATASLVAVFASAAWAEDFTLDVTAWKGNEAEPVGIAEIIELFEAA